VRFERCRGGGGRVCSKVGGVQLTRWGGEV
jgi:hypothetical protein